MLFLAPVAGMAKDDPGGVRIDLPSGAVVFWQETLHDTAGGLGLTARFRFVMPDLAQRVPSTSGSASDFVEEEERGPIDIDTESGEIFARTSFMSAAPVTSAARFRKIYSESEIKL